MSLIRPQALRATGLGVRQLHSSRILAVRASMPNRDAVISANETAGFKYVPGGPILKGTVNDATTFPEPSKAHGSYHWAFERLLSASLVPMTVAAAATSSTAHPVLDGIFAVSLIVHSHIGFDSCIEDYLHPRKWGAMGHVFKWTLRAATGLSVWGVYEFNTNDIGLTELIKRVWTA